MVKELANDAEFEQTLAEAGDKCVIIDFFATWCGPCVFIGPKFVELAKEFEGKAIFVKVDVDKLEGTSQKCEISAMPTFQVWKNNSKVDELVGASEDKLRQLITKNT